MKMTQTKKRAYFNGMVTNTKILKVLALNEEFAQSELPKKVDRKYRQVIRCLHNLRDKHLIYLKRTEQSQKGGKEKNFWAITFYGLMEILKYLDNKEIDLVAHRHSDKWLVFAEWPYLQKKGGGWLYVAVRGVSLLSFHSLQANVAPKFTDREVKQMGFTPKQWKELDSETRGFVLENTKQECTDKVLGFKSLFGSREIDLFRFLLNTGEKRMLLESARRTSKLFVDNPRIREYIDKRFEQEKAVHKLVDKIEAQWKRLKKSYLLKARA